MEGKSVSFGYKSIGNFVKLLATIRFENTHEGHDIALWHERFDDDAEDELFEKFLIELFPEGKTIYPEDIEAVVHTAERFLETDEKAKTIKNKYIKRENPYWVYFKPENKVYPCRYANHSKTVFDICVEFFKGMEDIDLDYLERFIITNFEIKSDNLTIEHIAEDASLIQREIVFNAIEKRSTYG